MTDAAWATQEDVIGLWIGPKSPTDTEQVDTFCTLAKSVIVGEFPDIQTRMNDDENLATRCKLVVVQLVQALYRNPDRVKYFQNTTGPFGKAANPDDTLLKWLTPTEDQRAMLVSATKRQGSMVNMDPHADFPGPYPYQPGPSPTQQWAGFSGYVE